MHYGMIGLYYSSALPSPSERSVKRGGDEMRLAESSLAVEQTDGHSRGEIERELCCHLQAHNSREENITTMTSTPHHHNRMANNPFVVAMALGAGMFLLLQLVANRILSRQEQANTSSSLMIPASHKQVQRTAYEMPVDLFNDEFFMSPFMFDSELVALKKDMDRQMEALVGATGGVSPLLRRDKATSLWEGFDIQEDEEKVIVTVSVPEGITQDDITIEVIDGSVMHIAGFSQKESGGTKSQMRFDKRFALGRNMEQDKIAASLKGGVLTVTTPKAGKLLEKKEVRKIPIKVEL